MPVAMSAGLPKLLREPAYCQVATLVPGGPPQVTQVWVDTDGEHIIVNTAEGRQKVRNVRCDPRVAVNVVDQGNPWRLASIRGCVMEITAEGGDQTIDQLAKKYMNADSYPFRKAGEVRLNVKIAPEKVNEMGPE